MENHYDIFKRTPDGSKTWLSAVGSLHEAQAYLQRAQKSDTCEYVICDLLARRVLAVMKPGSPKFTSNLLDTEDSFFVDTPGSA